MLMPAVCHGQAKCPWINEPTARGILGGDVTMSVNLKDGGGVCEFSRQQGQVRHQVTVQVIVMSDIPKQFSAFAAQCSPDRTPLRAIGNEAVMCSTQTHSNLYVEKVVGRVREQAFIVTVGSSVRDDASMTEEMRREKAHLVAEQVAGILF